MARKRSGRHTGGARRSQNFKNRTFQATCQGCGKVAEVPVRPPPGVALYCITCNAAARDRAPTATP
jgi:CxxC-x17-CxxC domain-containing protein